MKFRIRYADQVVGAFVLLAIAVLAFIVVSLGSNQRWFARDYRFKSRFASASGITPGTAIQLKGFKIGRIKNVTLTDANEAAVDFVVYDTFIDKVRANSLLELVVSPIGLGNQLLFHPGKSTERAAENSFIPAYDTPEGMKLVDARLVDMPPKDDTITRLLFNVNTTIEEVKKTLQTVNPILAGQGAGPIKEAMDEAVAAVAQVNAILADLDDALRGVGGGPLAKTLNSVDAMVAGLGDSLQGRGGGPIARSLGGVDALIADLDQALQGKGDGPVAASLNGVSDALNTTLPRLDGMVARVQTDLPVLLDRVDGMVANVQSAVPPLLATVDATLASVQAISANLEKTSAALADPTGLVPKLLAPEGSIKTFLNDGDRLFDRVDGSLAQVETAVGNLADTTATLSVQMPRIAAIIEEARTAIVKAQDVLEGLKNNPLLSGGIPERVEAQAAPTNLRTTDF
jgi:phospholipid/cholesterol/gamma-HCH transport system substrate-binding protein